MSTLQDLRTRRRERLRFQLGTGRSGRPRLSVFRSGKRIYAQVIDDAQGRTLAAASSLDKTLRGSSQDRSRQVRRDSGCKLVAERAVAAGHQGSGVRSRCLPYHGRVKALAEAAREGGLAF